MLFVVGSRPYGAWAGEGREGGLLENQQSKGTELEGHTTPAAVAHRAQFRRGCPIGWN